MQINALNFEENVQHMQTKKWLCILFLYSNLMSSERKIASKSKKEKHTNPCHPSIANHDSFLSPPPSKVITLHRPVRKRFCSGENTFNKQDPMPWTNLVWPERMGRRHSTSHDSAIMNYLKIIPLVFWDIHFPPNKSRWRVFPLAARGKALPWVSDQGRGQPSAQYMQWHMWGSCQCQNLEHNLFKHV